MCDDALEKMVLLFLGPADGMIEHTLSCRVNMEVPGWWSWPAKRGWDKVVFRDAVVPPTSCEGQDASCASRSPDQCQVGVDVALECDSRVGQCTGLCTISLGKTRCSGTRWPDPND